MDIEPDMEFSTQYVLSGQSLAALQVSSIYKRPMGLEALLENFAIDQSYSQIWADFPNVTQFCSTAGHFQDIGNFAFSHWALCSISIFFLKSLFEISKYQEASFCLKLLCMGIHTQHFHTFPTLLKRNKVTPEQVSLGDSPSRIPHFEGTTYRFIPG